MNEELPVDNYVWSEVEVNRDIDASQGNINTSRHFVEACSLTELDHFFVWSPSFWGQLWWMLNNFFQQVVHQGLIVHVAELNNDLEGYEMDDTMLNRMLEC